MHLHVEAMPDDPGMQAFLYGPLVLAGDLGNEGLTEAHIIGPNLRVGAPDIEQYGSPLGPVNTNAAGAGYRDPDVSRRGRRSRARGSSRPTSR